MCAACGSHAYMHATSRTDRTVIVECTGCNLKATITLDRIEAEPATKHIFPCHYG